MGYPIGVPIWVLQENKSLRIIDNVVKLSKIKQIHNQKHQKSLGFRVKNIVKNE